MNLTYFIGKPCLLHTVDVQFKHSPVQNFDYFMGVVEAVDNEFVWIKHPQLNTVSGIARQYLVSIAEEQVLYEDNLEHAKIIEEYKKEKPEIAKKTAIPARVDPKGMAELSKKMQSRP